MSKKYKLTSETKEVFGVKLHRIEALMDFDDVEKLEKLPMLSISKNG